MNIVTENNSQGVKAQSIKSTMVKVLLFTTSHTYAYDFVNSSFQEEKCKTLQGNRMRYF